MSWQEEINMARKIAHEKWKRSQKSDVEEQVEENEEEQQVDQQVEEDQIREPDRRFEDILFDSIDYMELAREVISPELLTEILGKHECIDLLLTYLKTAETHYEGGIRFMQEFGSTCDSELRQKIEVRLSELYELEQN